MNTLNLYYDRRGKAFFDPFNGGRRVWGVAQTKLDLYRLRVFVTDGIQQVSSSGVPLAGAVNLTAMDAQNAVFTIKTPEAFALESSGALAHGVGGFDATDTDHHNLTLGRFTIQDALPLELKAGAYVPCIALLDADDNSWSMDTGDTLLVWEVIKRAYTGSESALFPGSPVARWYAATIPVGADSVAITIAGFTAATGRGLAMQTGGSSALAPWYTAADGAVTIHVSGPALEATPVAFRLENL